MARTSQSLRQVQREPLTKKRTQADKRKRQSRTASPDIDALGWNKIYPSLETPLGAYELYLFRRFGVLRLDESKGSPYLTDGALQFKEQLLSLEKDFQERSKAPIWKAIDFRRWFIAFTILEESDAKGRPLKNESVKKENYAEAVKDFILMENRNLFKPTKPILTKRDDPIWKDTLVAAYQKLKATGVTKYRALKLFDQASALLLPPGISGDISNRLRPPR